MPYMTGTVFTKFVDDLAVPVQYVVSRDPNNDLSVHDHISWNALVKNLDDELADYDIYVDKLCQSLSLPDHGDIKSKITRIVNVVIDDPTKREEKLNEAIRGVDRIIEACLQINAISAKEGTYEMHNPIFTSKMLEREAEKDNRPSI